MNPRHGGSTEIGEIISCWIDSTTNIENRFTTTTLVVIKQLVFHENLMQKSI